jgi:quercetin dioxygenase-like cupin family protein
MRNFLKIAEGIDVLPLRMELHRQPELWDAHRERKDTPGTPHRAMSDIWLRHAASAEEFRKPHFAKWYPSYGRLPSARKLIFDSMARANAEHLGGVLITRIPPGGRIEAHTDTGWHPTFYNCKLYVVLATNPQCVFRVEDERVSMAVGDVWWIDNTKEHDVVNDGETDRMTLIICMRTEG